MPSKDQLDRLRDLLIKHEGIRLNPYICPSGKLTIGVGRNLEDVGITTTEAMQMLTNDLSRVMHEAHMNFPWFGSISVVRQDVIISMIFNMGLTTFKGFKKFISYMQTGNFSEASKEMLNSKWSTQVGKRASELSKMMLQDKYQ